MKLAVTILNCVVLSAVGAGAQTQKPNADAEKIVDTQVNLIRKDWRDQRLINALAVVSWPRVMN